MEAVLERALKLHADERYGTAREMREALEACGAAPAKAAQSHVGSSLPPAKAAQAPAKAAQSHVGSNPPPAPLVAETGGFTLSVPSVFVAASPFPASLEA